MMLRINASDRREREYIPGFNYMVFVLCGKMSAVDDDMEVWSKDGGCSRRASRHAFPE